MIWLLADQEAGSIDLAIAVDSIENKTETMNQTWLNVASLEISK
jgi:hypothetical protein